MRSRRSHPRSPLSPSAPRSRRGALGALLLGLALLLPGAAQAISTLPFTIEGGKTLALPLPSFFTGLHGVDVDTEGVDRLFLGIRSLDITGGLVEGPAGFTPFTGTFEHAGTSLSFSRGDDELIFRDLVVDTALLELRADVDVVEDGVLSEALSAVSLFDLTPLLPALPPLPGLPGLPGGGLPGGGPGGLFDLPTLLEGPFGEDVVLDLLRGTFSDEAEDLFADVLFSHPRGLPDRPAVLLGIAAKLGPPIPEPATALLMAAGLAGLAAARRRRA